MAKLKVQAQHLQPGDIVGSGEKVSSVILNSINWPSNKCKVSLYSGPNGAVRGRSVLWGKYTIINVERANAFTS